jgi:hypothetical protein
MKRGQRDVRARRDEPLIVAGLFDEVRIADGNHRLEKRHHDGLAPLPILVIVVEPLGF